MDELQRVDPKDCGCTDCITGYSKPIDFCTEEELTRLHLGLLKNASGYETKIKVEVIGLFD